MGGAAPGLERSACPENSRREGRLARLHLRSPYLGLAPIAHPALAELVLSPRRSYEPEPVEALARANLPGLRALAVFAGQVYTVDPVDAREQVMAAITNPELGRARGGLERLCLGAIDLEPEFLAELAKREALLRELVTLQLPYGTLGDEHVPALKALLAAAPKLARLDLTCNYLSEDAAAELRALAPGRVVVDRQKRETDDDIGERQIPMFGRYGEPDDPFA